VLLRVCAIQARQRLDCFNTGEWFIHVHRMQKRLVVTGLELVGADQEAIWVFLNHFGDLTVGRPLSGASLIFAAPNSCSPENATIKESVARAF
jgi:hypothetical protein